MSMAPTSQRAESFMVMVKHHDHLDLREKHA